NNLKQIALALSSYLDAHGVYPSGSYNETGPVLSDTEGYKVSWSVSILPYLEQRSLYDQFNFRLGADAPENFKVTNAHVSSLNCPSEGTNARGLFGGISPFAPGKSGTIAYAGCHHDVEAPIDVDNHGVLFLNSHIRVVDVPDGLSQTIFVGE